MIWMLSSRIEEGTTSGWESIVRLVIFNRDRDRPWAAKRIKKCLTSLKTPHSKDKWEGARGKIQMALWYKWIEGMWMPQTVTTIGTAMRISKTNWILRRKKKKSPQIQREKTLNLTPDQGAGITMQRGRIGGQNEARFPKENKGCREGMAR
jgi:hypothetical protein